MNEYLSNSHIGYHGQVAGLRDDGLRVAAALGPEEGDDTRAAHVGQQARRRNRIAARVVPLQQQTDVG